MQSLSKHKQSRKRKRNKIEAAENRKKKRENLEAAAQERKAIREAKLAAEVAKGKGHWEKILLICGTGCRSRNRPKVSDELKKLKADELKLVAKSLGVANNCNKGPLLRNIEEHYNKL